MKGPLSRLAAFKKGLILQGVFLGAGPGLSGVFEVGVRPLARSAQLWHWDDDNEDASLLEEINSPYSWSATARSLAASQLGGETLIGAITVVGAEGDAADVLRLAWGDEDTKRLARQLATCSVEQLAVIRSEVGPLTSRNALRRLSKLALDLDGIESADFGSLFPETTTPGNLIATLRKSIRTHLAQLARHATRPTEGIEAVRRRDLRYRGYLGRAVDGQPRCAHGAGGPQKEPPRVPRTLRARQWHASRGNALRTRPPWTGVQLMGRRP